MADGNTTPATVWQERFNGLLARICNLGQLVGLKLCTKAEQAETAIQSGALPLNPQVLDKEHTLACLIQALDAFAKGQFNFFQNKLKSGGDRDGAPSGYTHQYALSLTLGQISRDLEVIERAVNQRLNIAANVDTRRKLLVADQLAYAALKPAIRAGILTGDLTVMTYLQKSAAIRVMPYAKIAMIGVPYTSLTNQQDLLAIPHEVGHYVYWHGNAFPDPTTGLALKIHEALADVRLAAGGGSVPGYIKAWTEETFADYYGCCVAGPVMALDFQDMEVHNASDAQLLHDDGEHPLPALRAYIYLHGLKLMEELEWSEELKDEWEQKRLGNKVSFEGDAKHPPTPFTPQSGEPVRLSVARDALIQLVNVIAPFLEVAGFKSVEGDLWRDVYAKLRPSKDVGKLYQTFEDVARKVEASTLTVNGWDAVKDTCASILDDNGTGLKTEILSRAKTMQILTGRYGNVSDADLEWFAMLSVGNWTTGPGGGGNPGTKGG